jgi:phenylacetate-CoA ligase
MVQVADFIQQSGIEIWNPKLIQVTSSPISLVQKDLLSKVFHAPICDQYGSCEVRWIAQSCPQDCGLHVNVEHVHLEFVDGKNRMVEPGHYGRTLLTNLEDTVFPMIRYENGDRGRYLKDSCQCGRTLPLIDSVKGRESESFTLPSGKTINGEYLTTIFDEVPELVRNFRVIQHRDMSITVESVLASAECRNKVEKVVGMFAGKIGNEVSVKCRFVDSIADDRGKLRFIIREQ